MLVLNRKLNQTIIIADSIRVTVVGLRGKQVRLGIEAPTQIPIHREEVHSPLCVVEQRPEPPPPVVLS
jgi:carbon storage regulator